jgi:hypothetical protein
MQIKIRINTNMGLVVTIKGINCEKMAPKRSCKKPIKPAAMLDWVVIVLMAAV